MFFVGKIMIFIGVRFFSCALRPNVKHVTPVFSSLAIASMQSKHYFNIENN